MEAPKTCKLLKSSMRTVFYEHRSSWPWQNCSNCFTSSLRSCIIYVGQRATIDLSKGQGRFQLTPNHDLTVQGLALTLYLTSTDKSIGALLVQKVEGFKHPIYYYLSRSLQDAMLNYPSIERH